jgi:hypothetical protein
MTNRDKALAWHKAGHYVLPGEPGTKRPPMQWTDDRSEAIIEHPTKDDIKRWWKAMPDAEVLVVPGRAKTPLIVIDVDWHPGGHDGREWLANQPDQLGIDVGAGEPSSSGNGEHHWRRATGPRNGNPGFPGVDVKSWNGLVKVTHYPAPIKASDVTDDVDPTFVTEWRGGKSKGAGDMRDILQKYAEPGAPTERVREVSGRILSEGQGHREVGVPLKALVHLILEGEPGALDEYVDAKERWSSHPKSQVEASWDSWVRSVVTSALDNSDDLDPRPLRTAKQRAKARRRAKKLAKVARVSREDAEARAENVDEREVEILRILTGMENHDEAKRRFAVKTLPMPEFPTWDELLTTSSHWLVPNLLPSAALTFLVGRPNIGKSFVAVDIASCIATGRPYQGRDVTAGKVLYISGEGTGRLASRFEAWAEYHEQNFQTIMNNVQVATRVALASRDGMRQVAERAAEADLIVIDTLATVSGIEDENDAALSAGVMNAAMALNPDAAVLVLHHPNKSTELEKSPVMRGSGALAGRADVVITLTDDSGFEGGVPDDAERRYVRLSTDTERGGKVRDGSHESFSGMYLAEVGESAVITQSDGRHVTKREKKVAKHFTGRMTAQDYAQAAGIVRTTAYRQLESMVKQGKLGRVQEGREFVYFALESDGLDPED